MNTNPLMRWICSLKPSMEMNQLVGKQTIANFKSIMKSTVKNKLLILHRQMNLPSLNLVKDQNGKKHLRKLRNIKNNILHMIKFLILKFHSSLTGETSMVTTSPARSETRVDADHAILLLSYKLLNPG